MIISDKHKYLFIEIPHTASTAISNELRTMYDGECILKKHSSYFEFSQIATEAQKKYFIFGGIRNPLDVAVTKYFRLKTMSEEWMNRPEHSIKVGGSVTKEKLRRYAYIQQGGEFAQYFKRYYRMPYANVEGISYPYCNYIMRYEHLQSDFAQALKLIGIEPKRPLPQRNKTKQKGSDYLSYYDTPEIIEHAKYIYGSYMKKWGYDFPAEWHNHSVPWLRETEFRMLVWLKEFSWKYVRRSPQFYGQLFRYMR